MSAVRPTKEYFIYHFSPDKPTNSNQEFFTRSVEQRNRREELAPKTLQKMKTIIEKSANAQHGSRSIPLVYKGVLEQMVSDANQILENYEKKYFRWCGCKWLRNYLINKKGTKINGIYEQHKKLLELISEKMLANKAIVDERIAIKKAKEQALQKNKDSLTSEQSALQAHSQRYQALVDMERNERQQRDEMVNNYVGCTTVALDQVKPHDSTRLTPAQSKSQRKQAKEEIVRRYQTLQNNHQIQKAKLALEEKESVLHRIEREINIQLRLIEKWQKQIAARNLKIDQFNSSINNDTLIINELGMSFESLKRRELTQEIPIANLDDEPVIDLSDITQEETSVDNSGTPATDEVDTTVQNVVALQNTNAEAQNMAVRPPLKSQNSVLNLNISELPKIPPFKPQNTAPNLHLAEQPLKPQNTVPNLHPAEQPPPLRPQNTVANLAEQSQIATATNLSSAKQNTAQRPPVYAAPNLQSAMPPPAAPPPKRPPPINTQNIPSNLKTADQSAVLNPETIANAKAGLLKSNEQTNHKKILNSTEELLSAIAKLGITTPMKHLIELLFTNPKEGISQQDGIESVEVVGNKFNVILKQVFARETKVIKDDGSVEVPGGAILVFGLAKRSVEFEIHQNDNTETIEFKTGLTTWVDMAVPFVGIKEYHVFKIVHHKKDNKISVTTGYPKEIVPWYLGKHTIYLAGKIISKDPMIFDQNGNFIVDRTRPTERVTKLWEDGPALNLGNKKMKKEIEAIIKARLKERKKGGL